MRKHREYVACSEIVYRFSRKYALKSFYLWEILEEEFNYIKGLRCLMTQEEIKIFEDIIIERTA